MKKKEIRNNQGHGGGRPRLLSKEQLEALKNKLMAANISTTKWVRLLIKKIFNIEYSARQISRILRKLGMTLQKSYPHNYRRPKNSEELLQNQLNLTFELLKQRLKRVLQKMAGNHPEYF